MEGGATARAVAAHRGVAAREGSPEASLFRAGNTVRAVNRFPAGNTVPAVNRSPGGAAFPVVGVAPKADKGSREAVDSQKIDKDSLGEAGSPAASGSVAVIAIIIEAAIAITIEAAIAAITVAADTTAAPIMDMGITQVSVSTGDTTTHLIAILTGTTTSGAAGILTRAAGMILTTTAINLCAPCVGSQRNSEC